MKEWFKNNTLLIVLFVLWGFFLGLALFLFIRFPDHDSMAGELAKASLGISSSAIIGGIIKLIFDRHQEDRLKLEGKKEFKLTVLNQLRKVFDDVDSARLIMEAHKSAKTYSEKMQQNIIPSIVTLYDVKRSLVDSVGIFEEDKLQQLRVNIHYMIAYLQALANEYKKGYLEISNKQFQHEKLKEESRKRFIDYLIEKYPEKYYTDAILTKETVPEAPTWVWRSILELEHMNLFIEDTYDSPYRKMFVDFYEHCKKILKDQEVEKVPDWLREGGEDKKDLESIDISAKKGTLKEADSLVQKLMDHLNKKTENLSK
jgi:hypothetical protein